jgi:hypothetical protein
MSESAADRARAFVEFLDGFEEGGFPEYARRGRLIADELERVAEELDAERSARRALQERCERQQEILGKAVYRACVEAAP